MSTHSDSQLVLIQAALSKAYVFAGATPEEIRCLAEAAEWVVLEPGTAVLKEGELADALYVLAAGRFVVKESFYATMELVIARINPGDLVGELAFIDRQPASASVRSDGAAEVVRLSYDSIQRVFKALPSLESKFQRELIHTLASRIRRGNQGLRDAIMGARR